VVPTTWNNFPFPGNRHAVPRIVAGRRNNRLDNRLCSRLFMTISRPLASVRSAPARRAIERHSERSVPIIRPLGVSTSDGYYRPACSPPIIPTSCILRSQTCQSRPSAASRLMRKESKAPKGACQSRSQPNMPTEPINRALAKCRAKFDVE
jgi:hypothetical protein